MNQPIYEYTPYTIMTGTTYYKIIRDGIELTSQISCKEKAIEICEALWGVTPSYKGKYKQGDE